MTSSKIWTSQQGEKRQREDDSTADYMPLSDARSSGHEEICKILEARGGIDTTELDSQNPCYEIDHEEVEMDGAILIGKGAFGEVYLVKWRGTEIAVKTIRSSIASSHRVRTTFMKELALWQGLRHPNIVQFLGVLTRCDRLIFLTEYLRNGSLYDILKQKGQFDPPTTVAYALDIARGMNYLHQHKPHAIIHRDLTPSNVLLDESGHLKVTDFGLSKIAQEKDSYGYKMTGGTGSYRYMAPEVYCREAYGKSVDVFSFALIVHEMFQGRPSNRAESPEEVADRRAYEDSRPSMSSYLCPEEIKFYRLIFFEDLLDSIIVDVASESHRIARLGLDRNLEEAEEELRLSTQARARVADPSNSGEVNVKYIVDIFGQTHPAVANDIFDCMNCGRSIMAEGLPLIWRSAWESYFIRVGRLVLRLQEVLLLHRTDIPVVHIGSQMEHQF